MLRRKPPGKLLPSAHAVDREYRIMTALQGTDVPVAKTYALCIDDTVIGTTFFVMDYVDGRVFWDPLLPDLLAGAARRHLRRAEPGHRGAAPASTTRRVGLGDYGRPGNYFVAPDRPLDQAVPRRRRPRRSRRWTG